MSTRGVPPGKKTRSRPNRGRRNRRDRVLRGPATATTPSLCDGWRETLQQKHLAPTVTKRAQGILCNPLVPKLARLVPKSSSLVPKLKKRNHVYNSVFSFTLNVHNVPSSHFPLFVEKLAQSGLAFAFVFLQFSQPHRP